MYGGQSKLKCWSNLSFKEFSRICGVPQVLSGICTCGFSNTERCALWIGSLLTSLGQRKSLSVQILGRTMKNEVLSYYHLQLISQWQRFRRDKRNVVSIPSFYTKVSDVRFNKSHKNRFLFFLSWKEKGNEKICIVCTTSLVGENGSSPGSF